MWGLGELNMDSLDPLLVTVCVLVGVSLLLLLRPSRREQREADEKLRKLPGPPLRSWYKGGAVIGHMPELLRHKYYKCHEKWMLEYGPIFKYYQGPRIAVIVSDPDLVRAIGVKGHKVFHDRSAPPMLRKDDNKGLILGTGKYWESVRNEVVPLFQMTRLKKFGGIMHAKSAILAKRLAAVPAGTSVDMLDWLQAMTLDVIGSTAFGLEFDMQSGGEQTKFLQALVKEVMGPPGGPRLVFVLALLLPFIGRPMLQLSRQIPGTYDYLARKQREYVFKECEKIIAERRLDPKAAEKNDFLTLLIKAKLKDTGRGLTDSEIRQLVFEFLIAGSETTANTVAFAVYLLSQHPEKEAKMVEEIVQVLSRLEGQDEDGEGPRPTYEELVMFPYVEQVIQETMRLYPTAAIVTRSPLEDVVVGGHILPKGCTVMFPVWAMHRNPAYFPEPELFRPERWEAGSEESSKRHPYAYIPFGLGPRICIGFRFAMEEAKLTLIQLYRAFSFQLDKEKMGEGPLDLVSAVVLKPKPGVFVTVKARELRDVPAGAAHGTA